MKDLLRTRWAAIGAAVAVTLGAGGLATVRADTAQSVFVAVTPTRVLDTRVGVGLPSPLVGGSARKLDITGTVPVVSATGTATTGTVVPDGATAIVANVTALRSTSTGFVSVRPGTATGTPTTSNLNITAAGDVYPNSVTVELAADGTIELFYFANTPGGTTDLLLDIVGYYTDSTLQELSQRLATLEAAQATLQSDLAANTSAIAANSAEIATNTAGIATNSSGIATNTAGIAELDSAQPFAVTNYDSGEGLTSADKEVVSVTVTASVTGHVTVNSTTNALEGTAGDAVVCSITTGTTVASGHFQGWQSAGSDGNSSQLAGTRTYDIAPGATTTYKLVCRHIGVSGSSSLFDSVLTAIFTPAP